MCYSCGSCGCSCGCSSNCSCYETVGCGCPKPCPTTTTTTTTVNPNCEPCDEFYDCECVTYSGENIECYGLKTGDNLCEILETIIQNLPECKTTLPPLDCNFTARVQQFTTTTTCAPEEFIMEAFGVSRITLGIITSTVPFTINWGDGTIDSYAAGNWSNLQLDHTYNSAYTGSVKIISCNLSGITRFIDSNQATGGFCGGYMTIQTTELGKLDGATWIEVISQTTQGNIIDLPRSLTQLVLWGGDHKTTAPGFTCSNAYTNPPGQSSQGNTVNGNVKDLPPILIVTNIRGLNTITGDVVDIPRAGNLSLRYLFAIDGNNTISGNIINVPTPLDPTKENYLELRGWNTVTGNIADIPRSYHQIWIDGKKSSNNIPSPNGGNTLTGSLSDLPTSIVYFHVWGQNTISDTIQSINNVSSTIKYINIAGANTIDGDITLIACPNIETIEAFGFNTITGDISGLVLDSNFNNIKSIEIAGYNTISGDISGIPSNTKNFFIDKTGGSVGGGLTGNLSSLTGLSSLYAFGAINDDGSIVGDLADVPTTLAEFYVHQLTPGIGINTYTAGHTWPSPMGYLEVRTALSFNQTAVDNILHDLATTSSGRWSITVVSGTSKLILKGSSPTGGTSNADYITLTSRLSSSNIQFI